MADILTDSALTSLPLDRQMIYIRLLAMLAQAHSEDGRIVLEKRSVAYLCQRRFDYCEVALKDLEASGLLAMTYLGASSELGRSYVGASCELAVPNWAKLQGTDPQRREEKRREEKIHTKSPALASPKAPKTKVPKRLATPFPPEGLTDEQKRDLADSPSLKDITESQFRHAVLWAKDWSAAGGSSCDRVDWVAVIRKGINGGYALKGYGGGGNGRPVGRGKTDYSPAPKSANWDALIARREA